MTALHRDRRLSRSPRRPRRGWSRNRLLLALVLVVLGSILLSREIVLQYRLFRGRKALHDREA